MFRIVRIPASRIKVKYYGGSSRLYRTIRYYSNERERSELCPPPPPKKPNTGTAFTLGALALLGGAVLGYAKHDNDFRCWLTEQIPFTEGLIKFIFQEEKSYYENIKEMLTNMKESLFSDGGGAGKGKRKPIKETHKDYTHPAPVFPAVAKHCKEPEDSYTEIRLEGKDDDVETVDPKPPTKSTLPDNHPKNLAELEVKIMETASAAVEEYNTAVFALKNYVSDVEVVIEGSIDRLDPDIWQSLKQKTRTKDEAIRKAERDAATAIQDLGKLRELLNKGGFDVPDMLVEQARKNLNKVVEDINEAKKELEQEKKVANITEKYWKKVEEARQLFSKELEILFPSMKLDEKKVSIEGGDLDLFVLHAMAKVLYYQKELKKLETIGSEKLRVAVESARRGGLEVLTTEQICNELEKEKRKLEEDFRLKCLKLREENESELRCQLKRQSQAFADHLNDALRTRELEVEKELTRTFDEQLVEERCKFKIQVASMIGRLRGLDQAIKDRAAADKSAHQSQVLWSACQALYRSVKSGCPGLPWTEQLRPLEPEIHAVKKAAADNDDLVKAVLKGIPLVAQNRGVFPEDALRERFLKVEKIATRLSLVPEEGAQLHMYLLSYLQSMLLLKAPNPIPQSELNDETTDFSNLSANEIIQRARYWLDRGDFGQTLRYMNLLTGAPRAVARQWMEETRILLETQQAANTLMAHACASGLMYL